MKLTGKIIKDTRVVRETTVVSTEKGKSFRDSLEECLVEVCKQLDTGVPMWLKKNTGEFACFHKTSFFAEQFMEDVYFDRLEIYLEA